MPTRRRSSRRSTSVLDIPVTPLLEPSPGHENPFNEEDEAAEGPPHTPSLPQEPEGRRKKKGFACAEQSKTSMPPSPPVEGTQGGLDYILLNDLKEYFECPVCYCVPRRPPIFQCEKGHMICGTCRPRVHHCPQCRADYKGHRLYFAERLLEKVPVPCKYSEEGCQVELVWSRLQKHEDECTYGEVECPNTEWGCQENIVRRKMDQQFERRIGQTFLMRHLAKEHKVKQETILDFSSLNQILLFLLVVSVAVNAMFLAMFLM